MNERSAEASLQQLFDAERGVRRAHAELAASPPEPLVALLSRETREALALAVSDAEEATLRLVRIAELLSDLEGPTPVDLLVDILSSTEPEARVVAGEALQGLAFDRFKEVALGVERALGRLEAGSPALSELPYILAEVPEPGIVKLLGRFLDNKDPEGVAAAIEALVEVGDPEAAKLLPALLKDKRPVTLDDEGELQTVTVGELATEALEFFRELLVGPGHVGTPGPGHVGTPGPGHAGTPGPGHAGTPGPGRPRKGGRS